MPLGGCQLTRTSRVIRRALHPATLGSAFVVLCSLACLRGCAGPNTSGHEALGASSSEPTAAAISEISEARLSSDGSFVAVCGFPATGKNEGEQRVWFFDANTASVVGASPSQYDSELPDWGPGGSYLMALGHNALFGSGWELYYAPDPRTPPRPLAGPGRDMLRFPMAAWQCRLAPGHKTAVVLMRWAKPGAEAHSTKVFSVPLNSSGPARAMWSVRTEGWVTPLGVYERPGPQGGTMALFAGGPWGPQPGIIALLLPEGTVPWDRPFAPEPGWFHDSCLYDSHTLLVLEETERSEAEKESSVIYAVDLGTGDSRVFAEVPDECRWVRVFPASKGHRLLLTGDFNVWSILIDAAPGKPEQVIKGPTSMRTRTAGARYSADHGLEVYAWSWHVLWRCRLGEGKVEPVLGRPQAEGDEPPKIVGPVGRVLPAG